jgi:hypothetical protein
MAKKPTEIVPTMLRMREDLRKRLEREAKKRDHSLNAEMVERLEASFVKDEKAERDAAIIDMFVFPRSADDIRGALVRNMTIQLAKNPNWPYLKHAKELLDILSHADESQPGDDE